MVMLQGRVLSAFGEPAGIMRLRHDGAHPMLPPMQKELPDLHSDHTDALFDSLFGTSFQMLQASAQVNGHLMRIQS